MNTLSDPMVPTALSQYLETRARRIALAGATWGARGLDDASGVRTVRAELLGLAAEAESSNPTLAALLSAAGQALACIDILSGYDALYADRRILVLDDTEVTSDLAALALEGLGCTVSVVDSARALLRALDACAPDALMLEPAHLDFKETTALQELVSAIRERRELVPVILFSSCPDEELRLLARELAANAVLRKDQGLTRLIEGSKAVLDSILW